MNDFTLICTVPLRDGRQTKYYSIPAKGGEACIRWEGIAPISAWAGHPRMRGLVQWASRKAGRQVDVLADGRIRFQEA